MPPKRESSTAINGNTNAVNNNEVATTTTTNDSTVTVAINLQANATNTNTTPAAAVSATAAPANGNFSLPVLLQEAAAEQRTVAYQANAKLCRLVRKCPWMYDRNHHNYAKKHILDKSWCKIARECNDSGEYVIEHTKCKLFYKRFLLFIENICKNCSVL